MSEKEPTVEIIADISEELDIVVEAAQPESHIGWSSTRCISV